MNPGPHPIRGSPDSSLQSWGWRLQGQTGPGWPHASPGPASSSRKPPAPSLLWASSVCRIAQAWVPRITHAAGDQDGQSKKPRQPLPSLPAPGWASGTLRGPGQGQEGARGSVGTYLARPRPSSEKDLPEHRECWPGDLGGLQRAGPSRAGEHAHSSGCRAGRPARAPRLPALRRLRGARRPRQHKQACGAAFLLLLQPPTSGEGHASTQAHRPSPHWPGRHCLQQRGPHGRGHPGASSTSPGPVRPTPRTGAPLRTLPPPRDLGALFPTWTPTLQPAPCTPVLSGSPMHGRAGHPQGPCLSTGSLGCTAGLQTPPSTPAPGAQRVTAGAAGGRPRQTPTRHPRTPLTTPPPTCEHSLPRAARAWALGAALGPSPPPPYRRGGGRCGPGRGAGSAASWAAPSLRWRFQDNTRATGSQWLKLGSRVSPCPPLP